MPTPKRPTVNDKVLLNVPDNIRLHEKEGIVRRVEDWGAVVATPAAFSGEFRATWDEMIAIDKIDIIRTNSTATVHEAARMSGYTGDVCPNCQGMRMVRTGTCVQCEDCQTSSGGCG